MADFGKAYKDAAAEIGRPSIDAQSVLDEARRRRVKRRMLCRKGATFASVILIIFVGGFTSAKAAGYLGSVIRVNERGFVSGDPDTMTSDAGVRVEQEGVMPFSAGETQQSADDISEAPVYEEIEEFEFDSVEVFRQAYPEMIVALPEISAEDEAVYVCGDSVYIRYQVGEGQFVDIQIFDYHGSSGHSASVSFGEEICNERTYTTKQGFSYTLIDGVKESESDPLRIHGAISVEYYEVFINFYGYEEEEAEQILESIDLSPYCGNE